MVPTTFIGKLITFPAMMFGVLVKYSFFYKDNNLMSYLISLLHYRQLLLEEILQLFGRVWDKDSL